MNSNRSVGMAVSAAFAAALIGLANAPASRADTEPEPFQDLFGDSGINAWTPAADSYLDTNDPTLAATLATSVENFDAAVTSYDGYNYDPLSQLVYEFDETAFSLGPYRGTAPGDGGLPDNAIGDLAVGLDYTLYASDLTAVGTDVDYLVQIPYDIVLGLLYLPLLPFVLAVA